MQSQIYEVFSIQPNNRDTIFCVGGGQDLVGLSQVPRVMALCVRPFSAHYHFLSVPYAYLTLSWLAYALPHGVVHRTFLFPVGIKC